jgi:hypothetical protein
MAAPQYYRPDSLVEYGVSRPSGYPSTGRPRRCSYHPTTISNASGPSYRGGDYTENYPYDIAPFENRELQLEYRRDGLRHLDAGATTTLVSRAGNARSPQQVYVEYGSRGYSPPPLLSRGSFTPVVRTIDVERGRTVVHPRAGPRYNTTSQLGMGYPYDEYKADRYDEYLASMRHVTPASRTSRTRVYNEPVVYGGARGRYRNGGLWESDRLEPVIIPASRNFGTRQYI